MLSMASISVLPHQAGERASSAKLGRSDTSMNERLFSAVLTSRAPAVRAIEARRLESDWVRSTAKTKMPRPPA